MAVTAALLEASADTTNGTSHTTGSVTCAANKLQLLWVFIHENSGAVVPTVTGAGRTWVLVAQNVASPTNRRLFLYRAGTASGNTGALTIDYAGATVNGCSWGIVEFTGSLVGTNGADGIVQAVASTPGTGTSHSVTLAAFSDADNATFGCFGAAIVSGETMVAGSGFTILGQAGHATPDQKSCGEFKGSNDTGVDASWTTSAAAKGIAVEIADAGGGGGGPTITTTSLPDGTDDVPYSQTVVATGGTTPYTWSIFSGSLPAGLTIASSTGVISGTPTTPGTSNFTVRVTDNGSLVDDQALSITINAPPPPPGVSVSKQGVWTFLLCDRQGNPLEDLTGAIIRWEFQYRLRRPVYLRMLMPADHEKVATLHTDGRPLVDEMRVLKCWRRSPAGTALRACVYMWAPDDKGEGDDLTTEMICFGPDLRLSRRLLRDPTGNNIQQSVSFTNTNLAGMLKELILRSNTGAGPCGVLADGSTTVDAAIPSQSLTFEFKRIGEALVELTEAIPFDYDIDPLDRTDGYLGRIHFHDALGALRSNVRFDYAMGGANCSAMERNSDMSSVANAYLAYGGQAVRKTSTSTDATSIGLYGQFEDLGVFEPITLQTYLDSLSAAAIALRKQPREIVKFTPQPDAVEPFVDFDLGDTFQVAAGARLRAGFAGVQRCYGFDVAGEGGNEILTNVYTSPE